MKNTVLNGIPELTRVSSKGQIVIPLDYRERMKIHEGEIFAVTSPADDLLVFKKIKNPLLKEDLKTLKSVEEAWKEIERGEFKSSTRSEFLKELKRW